MAELKICPFCGRVPIVEDCGDNRYFVRCKCGIAQDKLYGQRCDAVRRWNTRKQSAQQWIPCAERLPDKNGKYLVVGRQKAINILKFDGGRWYGKWGVVAWMPLPEPYKGENDG